MYSTELLAFFIHLHQNWINLELQSAIFAIFKIGNTNFNPKSIHTLIQHNKNMHKYIIQHTTNT